MTPNNTAIRTALWRALHSQIDAQPFVFEDEIGLKLIDPTEDWQQRPDMKFTKRIRASIVARARYVEDLLMEQIKQGVSQYVILGSGLDTFAQRRLNEDTNLHIFEIDHPDTLTWKQERLKELGYGVPNYLHFVPVDFETDSWYEALMKGKFDKNKKSVIASTGVTLYLTKEAIISTLNQIATFASGSTLAMTFNLPIELVDEDDKPLIEMSIKGAHASGTPMISFFAPDEILALAREAGFKKAKTISTKEMKQLYFANRTDDLYPASGEIFLIATT
ncbi:MAG: class I SAM-dependent methyltransferase [Bacteroidales bacterium]|nr:class I SAM-dependent methyltransferase [Bacteroidales bacterium]